MSTILLCLCAKLFLLSLTHSFIHPNLYTQHFPCHHVKAPTFILVQCPAQQSFFAFDAIVVILQDGKGHRSLVQHLQHCKAPNKRKSNFTKWHDSGTDPFPFLLKKQRIDQSAFNYAHQRDHYLEGETTVSDNFFVGDADHDFSQDSVEFPYVDEDASPPLVNNNIINLSLVPTVNRGLPYNRNAPLPPSYQFQIELQTVLDQHRINLTVHDENIDLV
jgi:hypothetical protein